jgi:metal-responsive CopG/Arc/MetJ family transcriptional regulator
MKVAISLPDPLARQIDQVRKKVGQTRSAFIRDAIERTFRQRSLAERIATYQVGYREHPDQEEEIAAAEAAAASLLAEEPWE